MTKELRDLLWQEHLREYLPSGRDQRKEEADQEELIERAIERLLHRNGENRSL